MRLLGYFLGALGVMGMGLLLLGAATPFQLTWSRGYSFQSVQLAGWDLLIHFAHPTLPAGSFVAIPWLVPIIVLVLLACAWGCLNVESHGRISRQ